MSYDGNASVQYFERDTYVGSRRMYCCGARDASGPFSAYWPHTAYFCPICGDLWGRAVMCYEFEYAPKVPGSWIVEKRPCAEHGDGQFLYAQLLEGCDESILTRELLALIETYK